MLGGAEAWEAEGGGGRGRPGSPGGDHALRKRASATLGATNTGVTPTGVTPTGVTPPPNRVLLLVCKAKAHRHRPEHTHP
jgi:hypothetical protein